MQRLNVIHWAMRELWQTSIRVPLAHEAASILDVGCGSGIWAKEVAQTLPRARVLGVDLSPTLMPDDATFPRNLSLEVASSDMSPRTVI
jgi:ubiquinone/menaquinone biosynthesis C-methylase UbiE